MPIPTHMFAFEGRSYETLNGYSGTLEAFLERLLGRLGQPGRSTFVVSRIPQGISFFAITPADLPSIFIQAAGTSEALTIEVRQADADGAERLYTVGKGGSRLARPDVVIAFNGSRSVSVFPDEVFDASAASEVFGAYVDTGSVPDRYTLRELDLTRK